MEGVLLARAFYVLVAHHFDRLLLRLELTLEYVELDAVLLERNFVLL